MEAVLFGYAAAGAVAEGARRLDARRVFLMVSATLNRETDEIEKVRHALGECYAGTFEGMPPHTPRRSVISAAQQAREVGAGLIVTIGGGSVTDGAKAVQLCLANDIHTPEALDDYRPVKAAGGTLGPPLGCGCRRAFAPWTIAWRGCAQTRQTPSRTRKPCTDWRCSRAAYPE
ncbi:MAG: iron-containing alcohol dehydrogenase [Burkholderiales bacterium]